MRASFSLYEHPQLSDSEVWPKDSSPAPASARGPAVAALLVFTIVAGGLAYHYTGAGRAFLQDSALFKQWL
ncbi:hypothetical protein H0H81_008131 [Sphagnurus paluster]|uniref:Uncharacterized protein n=1 Tax=Sphagnurus paluster TaxID=117069 RepID=A0A9P7K636_9AGAR|nr:hypothetical protein H0H81_008131 [Sphagnurus paluster]